MYEPAHIPTMRLYGLTRDELRSILDPKDVYGDDFPGEIFRVQRNTDAAVRGRSAVGLGGWFPI